MTSISQQQPLGPMQDWSGQGPTPQQVLANPNALLMRQQAPLPVMRGGGILPQLPPGLVMPRGRIPVAGRALPPPPSHVDTQREAVFADEAAFNQAQHDRRTMTPAKLLAREMIEAARRFNITTAPPAHIKPAVFSEPVDISNTVTVGASVVPTAYQTVCTFTTPPGRWARIEHYGVQVVDPAYAYTGELAWAFRLNGRFLDMGMSDWVEQRGNMVFMRPTFILMMHEGIKLDFMVRRPSAGATPRVVQMAFRGWSIRLRNNYDGTQGTVTTY